MVRLPPQNQRNGFPSAVSPSCQYICKTSRRPRMFAVTFQEKVTALWYPHLHSQPWPAVCTNIMYIYIHNVYCICICVCIGVYNIYIYMYVHIYVELVILYQKAGKSQDTVSQKILTMFFLNIYIYVYKYIYTDRLKDRILYSLSGQDRI